MSQVKLVQGKHDRLWLWAYNKPVGYFNTYHFVKTLRPLTPGIVKEIKAYEKKLFGKHRASILTSFFVFVANMVGR